MILHEWRNHLAGVGVQMVSTLKGFAVAEYSNGEWHNVRRFTSMRKAHEYYMDCREWWWQETRPIGGRP